MTLTGKFSGLYPNKVVSLRWHYICECIKDRVFNKAVMIKFDWF